jgi:creatinine amidohydrolase
MPHHLPRALAVAVLLVLLAAASGAQVERRPLLLPEMSHVDVREYLKTGDMLLVPLGSTEQHGPHLPLGTDSYEALALSTEIFRRTGIVVAPLAWVGYSEYHNGFPGTISVSTDTLARFLFECCEGLVRQGFRRILFLNYHGGNSLAQGIVIQRLNHETPAVAVAIGVGGSLKVEAEEEFLDWHAGVSETSLMLHVRPDLVRMDRAEKPTLRFSAENAALVEAARKDPRLEALLAGRLGVPAATGKGGASAELSSNGVWSHGDPKTATAERGAREFKAWIDAAVDFITAWRRIAP